MGVFAPGTRADARARYARRLLNSPERRAWQAGHAPARGAHGPEHAAGDSMDWLLVTLATPASYLLAWLAGVPILVPVLNTAAGFPFMVRALRRARVGRAAGLMLVWAAMMGLCASALAWRAPDLSRRLFLNAAPYEREMHAWIDTGAGAESTPREFLPQHALHAGAFAGLSFATGGLLSMPMGAALMNYMGHYVGTVAARSPTPFVAWTLAWHPWSVIRIASYVTLGVLLSAPMLARVGRFRYRLGEHRRLLALAGTGLLVDVVVKWLLAPAWSELLRRVVARS